MKKIWSNMVFDLVLAAILLALGIVLLPPVTSLGETVLSVIIAVLLVFYLVFFLFDRVAHAGGTMRILTAVEFAVIALIAIGLIFRQLKIFDLGSTCQILGVVIWLRGCAGAFRGYLVHTPEARRRFPVLMFMLSIALLTFGAILFAKPLFTDEAVIYTLAVLCILLAVALVLYALLYCRRPAKRKPAKKK